MYSVCAHERRTAGSALQASLLSSVIYQPKGIRACPAMIDYPVFFSGAAIILVAGLLSGVFVVPTRGIREWEWEHIWLVYSISAFLLVPPALALIFFPRVFSALLAPQISLTAQVGCYGVLFGIGCVLFGVTWAKLGIAVANALVSGVNVLVGSIGPVLVGAVVLDRHGRSRLLVGMLPLFAGLVLSAAASIIRDRQTGASSGKETTLFQSSVGILVAFGSGALSAMLNIGFSVGSPLEVLANDMGYAAPISSLAIWIPVLLGGFIANFAYPALLISRRSTWRSLARQQNALSLWLRCLAMGVLWSTAIFIYGYGARLMGDRGTTYGWAIVSGAGILGSLLLGAMTGEWRNSGLRSKILMAFSVAAMLLSFIILSIP